MDCCKETKYNLYLTDTRTSEISDLFNWDDVQIKTISEFVQSRGKFLIVSDVKEKIQSLSVELARRKIKHDVSLKW